MYAAKCLKTQFEVGALIYKYIFTLQEILSVFLFTRKSVCVTDYSGEKGVSRTRLTGLSSDDGTRRTPRHPGSLRNSFPPSTPPPPPPHINQVKHTDAPFNRNDDDDDDDAFRLHLPFIITLPTPPRRTMRKDFIIFFFSELARAQ